MSGPPAPPPKAPIVLLALLTLATMAGPFVIYLAIRGGESREWPPDRPAEWWTFGAVIALELGLMLGCLTAGLWARPRGD